MWIRSMSVMLNQNIRAWLRRAPVDAVGQIGGQPGVDRGLVHPIPEVVVHRGVRAVDGQLGEVRTTQAGQLGVQVGEQSGLHQRVVGDIHSGDQVAGVERDLFGLGEVVGRVAVERELADQLNGGEFLRDDFRRIEQVMPSNVSSSLSGNTWMPSSYSRNAPLSMPSAMSRR